jgi:hypothetical protein
MNPRQSQRDLKPAKRRRIEVEFAAMKFRDLPRDASIAIASVRAAGFLVLGSPRRKPKHLQLLAKKQDGLNELPVELDGHLPPASEQRRSQIVR